MSLKSAEAVLSTAAGPSEAAAGVAAPRASWSSVRVYDDPTDAVSAWAELESLCPASLYQTRRWILPWLATAGKAAGLEACIAVGYDAASRPAILLPLVIQRSRSIGLAYFAGGQDSNANMALIRPDYWRDGVDMERFLRETAALTRSRLDALILSNQPESWAGAANPLHRLPHQPSPSFSHAASLERPFSGFATRISASTRKKLRKKRDHLSQGGLVEHRIAASRAEGLAVLDAFFVQKLARLREKRIDSVFEQPAQRALLEALCIERIETGSAAIELHALYAGERIVAVYGGGVHQKCFHAMFNSFDFTPEIARSSPGELLLMAILETQCELGLDSFDLGIGEARYKETWCDRTVPLFDTLLALTARGHAFVALEKLRRRAKRGIKQNPRLWALAQQVRATLGARAVRE